MRLVLEVMDIMGTDRLHPVVIPVMAAITDTEGEFTSV